MRKATIWSGSRHCNRASGANSGAKYLHRNTLTLTDLLPCPIKHFRCHLQPRLHTAKRTLQSLGILNRIGKGTAAHGEVHQCGHERIIRTSKNRRQLFGIVLAT
jgi:hypothetical protein